MLGERAKRLETRQGQWKNSILASGRHAVFVEQFFHPDGWGGAQLPRDITTHLASEGFEVEVICGGDQYAPAENLTIDDPRDAGVVIRRIPSLAGGNIQRLKFIRQVWFCLAALPLLLVRRSPDAFITQTNPPLAVPLVAFAALIHRRPLVIIAQDLYPEVVFAHGMVRSSSVPGKVLSQLFRWAYSHAQRVVSLGPTMSERLIEKGVAAERIVSISNWSTGSPAVVRGSDNQLRDVWGLKDNFVLLYSGNLGISHDVETPILAMREVLRDTPNIRLVFIGNGSRLIEAKGLVKAIGIEYAVQFRSFVSSASLPHSLGLANLALVTLRAGFQGLVVPSKSLGYLARGIPMLYVGPESDVCHLIRAADSGVCVENGDTHGMALVLRRAVTDYDRLRRMGANGKRFYEEALTRSMGLRQYRDLLRSVTGRSGVPN